MKTIFTLRRTLAIANECKSDNGVEYHLFYEYSPKVCSRYILVKYRVLGKRKTKIKEYIGSVEYIYGKIYDEIDNNKE